jgi:hypothetical protein
MDWGGIAEVVIVIPFAIMFALCAFAMLRGVMGGSGHGGHGMMMCMGGHSHEPRAPEDQILEQLRAERHRLDGRIARAEQEVRHDCAEQ